jgi:hypothetical protein
MQLNITKKKLFALLTTLVAIIVISPLDDIAIAAVFGTAMFGFGSAPFYLLMTCSSIVSIAYWIKHKRLKETVPQFPTPVFS